MKTIIKSKITYLILIIIILLSAMGNVCLYNRLQQTDSFACVEFPDGNTRENYESIHHVKAAQTAGKGEGVKVGILDWCFGFGEHEDLYAGGRDFTTYEGHDDSFLHVSEHGYWMAKTLREIAPEAEIYALGTYVPDDEPKWVDAMIEGIQWAMENDIDILTLSHEPVSEENRERFDTVVDEAIAAGIVTTFIHYDNPDNILPWGIWNEQREYVDGCAIYNRDADINIFQYDYNTLFLRNYEETSKRSDFEEVYQAELFTSVSSMSVVTAGFVAILMDINDTLTPAQYKQVLIDTSRPLEYQGERAEHVVDMEAAVTYLQNHFSQ